MILRFVLCACVKRQLYMRLEEESGGGWRDIAADAGDDARERLGTNVEVDSNWYIMELIGDI